MSEVLDEAKKRRGRVSDVEKAAQLGITVEQLRADRANQKAQKEKHTDVDEIDEPEAQEEGDEEVVDDEEKPTVKQIISEDSILVVPEPKLEPAIETGSSEEIEDTMQEKQNSNSDLKVETSDEHSDIVDDELAALEQEQRRIQEKIESIKARKAMLLNQKCKEFAQYLHDAQTESKVAFEAIEQMLKDLK